MLKPPYDHEHKEDYLPEDESSTGSYDDDYDRFFDEQYFEFDEY